VDRNRLQEALTRQRFTLVSFGSNDALSNLSKSVKGMPAIAKGTLYGRNGRIVNLRCKLLETEGDKALGYVGGLAGLTESEWAMLGRSAQMTDAGLKPPPVPPGNVAAQPVGPQQIIALADERAKLPHPMRDPAFPFRIHMFVATNPQERDWRRRTFQERLPEIQGNDCIFPVEKGEVFELRVENGSGQKILLRLLVDGLSTLPEPDNERRGGTYFPKRVSLDEASCWVLDPEDR
jgi:hypothetical protein